MSWAEYLPHQSACQKKLDFQFAARMLAAVQVIASRADSLLSSAAEGSEYTLPMATSARAS